MAFLNFEFLLCQIEFLDFQKEFLHAQIEIFAVLNWFFMTLMYENLGLKRFSAEGIEFILVTCIKLLFFLIFAVQIEF